MNNLENFKKSNINIEDFNAFILSLEEDVELMEKQVRKLKFCFMILKNNHKNLNNVLNKSLFSSSYVKMSDFYEKILEIKKTFYEKEKQKISKEAKDVLRKFSSLKLEFIDLRNKILLIA